MKKKVKIILGLAVAVICAAAGVWSALRPIPVKTELLAVGTLAEQFTVQGALVPAESRILNAGTSGAVSEVSFRAGMSVAAGEVVVAITAEGQTDAELQLAQLRQQLSAARQSYDAQYGAKGSAAADLALAENEQAIAEWNYDAAVQMNEAIPGTYTETDMNQLRSRVTAAEKNLTLAQNANSDATRAFYQEQIASWDGQIAALEKGMGIEPVTAPFSGVLWETYVEEGAYVSKYQPVAKLYQPEDMKVEVLVLAEDAMRMRLGDSVGCALADGTAFDASVQYISTVAAETVSAVGVKESRSLVELRPVSLPAGVGAGYQVDARFVAEAAANVISAPASSIVPLPEGGDGVYLIRGGNAELAEVVTGRQSGGRVELVSGAAAGDRIVLDPFDSAVKDGSRVVWE
ncbi:MAG: HlyD family efflux transporter periplasmic adaptor subunit [Peptococcaceae bacterium]|jgi:HlyD family secretion protein|nr:HlyD family efflux transporter periplasmic adaptor subunit [Peptococcaceae bacterium]